MGWGEGMWIMEPTEAAARKGVEQAPPSLIPPSASLLCALGCSAASEAWIRFFWTPGGRAVSGRPLSTWSAFVTRVHWGERVHTTFYSSSSSKTPLSSSFFPSGVGGQVGGDSSPRFVCCGGFETVPLSFKSFITVPSGAVYSGRVQGRREYLRLGVLLRVCLKRKDCKASKQFF